MLCVREIAEKLLSTFLLIFIFSYYFIYNTLRGIAAEKEFDIVIQMALEHVLFKRFEKKEMNEKVLFNKDI